MMRPSFARLPLKAALVLTSLMLAPRFGLAADTAPLDGKALFAQHCAACHAAGPGHPGTSSLAIKYKGTDQPALLEERKDLNPAIVRVFVRYGVGAMPFFRKTEISDAEVEAIGRYLQKQR